MKNKRHGDVILVPVKEIPAGAQKKEKKVLAEGEVTGHAHRIDVGELFETKNGELYLKASEMTKVSHEEHITKTVDPGIYRVIIKRQYNPEGGWSNVKD